jgi:hypothetical protein
MFQHIGTVSHATLRPQDLIPALFGKLLEMDKERGGELWASWRGELSQGWGVLLPDEPGTEEEWDGVLGATDPETPSFILEELVDALNELAPPGLYFGTHPGDGSDFGFWPEWGAIEMGEYYKVSDPTELDSLPWDATEVVEINERGNVTFYVAERVWRPVWDMV